MNESINQEITALDIENELHHFPDVRRKNQNGRDNTKHEEKPYFRCGPQARKTIKSTQYLWKEIIVRKTVIIVVVAIILIMTNILLVSTIKIAQYESNIM